MAIAKMVHVESYKSRPKKPRSGIVVVLLGQEHNSHRDNSADLSVYRRVDGSLVNTGQQALAYCLTLNQANKSSPLIWQVAGEHFE